MNKNYFLIFTVLFSMASINVFGQSYNMCDVTTSTINQFGNLYDNGGPTGNYSNSRNCSFLIDPTCADSISLTFSSFSLESCCDRVYVYDGNSASGTLLYSGGGYSIPAMQTATSGSMFVRFTTDGSVTSSGFAASWTTVTTGAAPAIPVMADTVSSCGTAVVLDAGVYSGYLWNTGDTTQTISVSNSGDYYVDVIDTGVCTSRGNSYVNMINAQINQGDTTICAGSELTLTPGGCYFVLTSITDGSYVTTGSYSASGDDEGAIAVTPNYLYYTGDSYTGRFSADLSSYTSLTRRDGLFSDLSSGQLYTFWNSTYNAFTESTTYTTAINSLRTLDASLNTTGSTISLSQTINAGFGSYVFAGSGYVILWLSLIHI